MDTLDKSSDKTLIIDPIIPEKSFFNLFDLKKESHIVRDGEIIEFEHNLSYWNIVIVSKTIKNGNWVLYLTFPYKEYTFTISENSCDKTLFNKATARLRLHLDMKAGYSILPRQIEVKFSTTMKYLIFDSPYFYPHNYYFVKNHNYLLRKIENSVKYIDNFIKSYNSIFKDGIPILYVKSTKETVDAYEIVIIITSCLTISYATSEDNSQTIIFSILLNRKKKDSSLKVGTTYQETVLNIPRCPKELRSSDESYTFKFIVSDYFGA